MLTESPVDCADIESTDIMDPVDAMHEPCPHHWVPLNQNLRSHALSWKPCQGDSSKLNLPDHSTNVTKNATPETKSEHQKPSINPTPTNPKCIIALNDQDLINVVNTDLILLVKLKDIDSMSNMYTICRNEGFSDLNIHHVGGYWIWIQFPSSTACSKFQGNESLKRKFLFFDKEDSSALSSGRVCISSKSHHLFYENVQVEINKELFEATVQEISSWSIKINDDYLDTSSDDIIKELDISSESIDNHTDNKLGEAVIQQPLKEEVDNKVSNPDRNMARGLSSGLISMWDPNLFSKDAIWCDDSFIIIKENWKNSVGDCYMVNIYGPQDQVSKLALWNRLQDFIHHHHGSYIMFGDMNAVRNEQERVGSIFNNTEADHFNSFIDATGLVDLPLGGRSFTWMNKADGFDDLIKSEWELLDSNNNGFPIKCHDKFRILKSKIRQWNNNNKSLDKNKKTAAIEELSFIEKKIDAGSATHSDTENRLTLLHELEDIDKFASMDLIQKARVKWDIEGDKNSKFFHGLINQKRRNQIINGIMVEGIWITDPILIKDAFFQFYNDKFQAQDSQVLFPNLPHSHTLNTTDRGYLERLVTLEKIKEAVWDYGISKAPGPDGFSFAFVKKY
ncbi:RNA-directed DNA polymerase, eukaryota, reverse transcriptase zinc-binding domain protein [Tanacetum coccineum]